MPQLIVREEELFVELQQSLQRACGGKSVPNDVSEAELAVDEDEDKDETGEEARTESKGATSSASPKAAPSQRR